MEYRQITDLRPHPLNAEIYGDGCDAVLRDTVKKDGIVTPLLVTGATSEIGANIIISGHRRYNAAQMAGLTSIPVMVSPLTAAIDIEEAVILANIQRQKTNEQEAREYAKMKTIESQRALQRKAEGGQKGGGDHKSANYKDQDVENFPHLDSPSSPKKPAAHTTIYSKRQVTGDSHDRPSQKARDAAAEKIGSSKSGKTLEKAAHVVEVIDTLTQIGQTDEAQAIRAKLNTSVDAAYKVVKSEMAEPPHDDAPSLSLTAELVKKSTFNATNDNIEWAKWTWNPVTGCEHGCPYCYARDIANRFYPEKFAPTFHADRLNAPEHTHIPAARRNEDGIHNVFVCSMADLFGAWVDDAWIQHVLQAVSAAPQWNFLFLTKNPERYLTLTFPKNCWVGASADTQAQADRAVRVFRELHRQQKPTVTFLSCEPLTEAIDLHDAVGIDWVIIGGRSQTTGMSAGQPDWLWVESLLWQARQIGAKVYFKPNLIVVPKEYPQ